MKSIWLSLRFLYALHFKVHRERKLEVRTYHFRQESVTCDVYTPDHVRGTVVTINGFAPSGSRDPRIAAVNEALAACGFRVVSPTIPGICRFRIDPGHIDVISELLRRIAADFGSGGGVSVLAPSFSGSLAMLSAFRTAEERLVRAVCLIGSYADARRTLRSLFLRPDVDEYGRLILLKNFIHWSIGRLRGLDRALTNLLHDSYFKPAVPAFSPETVPPPAREFLHRLRNDESFRALHWKRIEQTGRRAERTLGRLCLVENARPVRTSVTLIHGAGDDVVPAEQSLLLYRVLGEHSVERKVVITPLLSHGDTNVTLSRAPALFELAGGFAHFFKAAAA